MFICLLNLPKASSFRWEAGPKPIDGVWAPWWYDSAHKSTGFKTERGYPKV